MFGIPSSLSQELVYWILGGLLAGEILLLVFVIVLWVRNSRLKKKMTAFLSGKDGKDLEKVLLDQIEEVKELDTEIQELFEISNRLRELAMKSLHKTAVLRFNPFKEVGGNQSFSVAFLNGKNSGVVVSSLHTREGTRVYAKPVENGQAKGFPLTDEEKAVIAQAIGKTIKV